jgi:hypothetical protein
MGVHGSHISLHPTRIQPILKRNKSLWRQRASTAGTVQCSQYQPPGGEPVSAIVGRADEAVVGAAADAIGKPLGEGGVVGRRPATVLIEPVVSATYSLGEGQHTSAG